MMEWNGGMDWTGMVEWNGMERWNDRGPVSRAHNSWLTSQSYCKPCKQYSGHPSTGAMHKRGAIVLLYEGIGCVHISIESIH